jgi:predicted dienelactone hydrolase
MRLIEIFIIATQVAGIFFCCTRRDQHSLLFALSVTTVILIVIHLALGGYRWQMLPSYAFGVFLFLSSLLIIRLNGRLLSLGYLLALLGIVSLLISAILSYLFPLFTFPEPTGQYPVGTRSLHLIDKLRTESCAPFSHSYRELVVQISYPAVKTNGTKAPYLKDKRLIPQRILYSHLGLIETNAIQDAPITTADAPYPVILYSPSWSGYRTDNTFQTEELASHGFVVIALEHPCAVPLAIYPNGRVVYSNLMAADYTSSDEAMNKFLQVAEEQIELRTKDVIFVLQELPKINSGEIPSPFVHTLDLNKIGIFGHSFGGAVAAEACFMDRRLKTGLNMDGLLFGKVAEQGASQPFFFMNSDVSRPTRADLHSSDGPFRRESQTNAWGYHQMDQWFNRHGGYYLKILGASHMDFSDYPLRSRLREFNGGGKIPTVRAMKIINDYTVAFFNKYLKGKDSPLLQRESGSPYKEVVFQKYQQTENSVTPTKKIL